MLKVYLPYAKNTITQRFGENANTSYARDGLKGHTAYDWGVPWGTPVPNCTPNAYCYSLMHVNDPVLNHYRAAFFLVETDTGTYEVSYGHLSKHIAEVGKTYQPGDTIGLIGNTGDVFSDHEVTEAEKEAGSHAGAHLHGPQIRPVKKTKFTLKNKHYLETENGKLLSPDGLYYEVINYDNGYNGCISLAPFSTETLATDFKAVDPNAALIQGTVAIGEKINALPDNQKQALIPGFRSLIASLIAFLKGG